jgi:hypothetical protein
MGSEQYSETPLPDGNRCPQCGKLMPAKAQLCSLCAQKHAIQEGLPTRYQDSGDLPELRAEPAGDRTAWAVFGVLAILICVGLAFTAPGMLIVLLIVATPALIRALIVSSRKRDETEVAIPPSFFQIFFSSLGVAVLVGTAAAAAFFAACFVTGFGAMALTNSIDGGVWCGIVSGAIMGLVVAVWLLRRLWSRKD